MDPKWFTSVSNIVQLPEFFQVAVNSVEKSSRVKLIVKIQKFCAFVFRQDIVFEQALIRRLCCIVCFVHSGSMPRFGYYLHHGLKKVHVQSRRSLYTSFSASTADSVFR